MKILLDHNLDRNLKRHFAELTVETAREMGWSALINGELLAKAEAQGFNVLITADKHIKNQQNLRSANCGISSSLLRQSPQHAFEHV